MSFRYLNSEMDEDYYRKMWKMRRKASGLAGYADFLDIEEKRSFLIEGMGFEYFDVWCGDEHVGTVDVATMKGRAVHGFFIGVREEIRQYINAYQEWRRTKRDEPKIEQGEFNFTGTMGNYKPDMSNRNLPGDHGWRRRG